MKLFLQKNAEFLSVGGLPPDLQISPPPHCEILATRLTRALKVRSDYFTGKFPVEENKTKIRYIHSHIFHLLF